jgi:hypothetical protein
MSNNFFSFFSFFLKKSISVVEHYSALQQSTIDAGSRARVAKVTASIAVGPFQSGRAR